MARYRKIDTRTWNDKKFNELSDDGKLVFFLLLTHPYLMPIGAMRASLAGFASELHWSHDRFKKAFEEIHSKNMVKHDEVASFVWLPNFIKYNLPESPNVVRSWEQYLDYLPECELKNKLILCVRNFIETLSFKFQEALPYAFGKAMPNQEQEQEQEKEQEKNKLSGAPDALLDKNIFLQTKQTKKLSEALYLSQAYQVLEFLNEKTGKAFRPVDANIKLIIARLKSGATVEDCRGVIAKKFRQWNGDKKTAEWLRPLTLFNPENFEQYLGELVLPKNTEQTIST